MSSERNEFITYSREAGFDTWVEYDASNNAIYIGEAHPGALVSEAKWRICKLAYDASNNMVTKRWADSTDNYEKIWNSRATYNFVDI